MKTYTVKEVATILQLSEYTIRKYLRDDVLKGIKTERSWRITQEEIDKYLKGD